MQQLLASPFPRPIHMLGFAHGLCGLMQTFLTNQFFRPAGKVPTGQGWRNVNSQAQRALIFSFPHAGFNQCLFQTFQAYYRAVMAFNHGGLAIPIGLAEITGYDNAILFCTLHETIPSALSRLNIRIDGGPGGCGREARRKVYGNIH